MVWGHEWMTDGANNLALHILLGVLGPMRGSYDGPYPDEAAAFAAVGAAMPFDLRQLPTDRIVVDGRAVVLRPGLGEELLKAFEEGPATDVNDPGLLTQYGEAHATLVGRCVILEIPGAMPVAGKEHRALILLDAVRGLQFACYRRYAMMRLRVIWE